MKEKKCKIIFFIFSKRLIIKLFDLKFDELIVSKIPYMNIPKYLKNNESSLNLKALATHM